MRVDNYKREESLRREERRDAEVQASRRTRVVQVPGEAAMLAERAELPTADDLRKDAEIRRLQAENASLLAAIRGASNGS